MITMIAAVAENGAIGKNGYLIWHNREDMARFKMMTSSPEEGKRKVVVVGRKTYESLRPSFFESGSEIVLMGPTTLEDMKIRSRIHSDDIWIIGGESVYRQFMPIADRLEITHIRKTLDGDTFFPEIGSEWWVSDVQNPDSDLYRFVTYSKLM